MLLLGAGLCAASREPRCAATQEQSVQLPSAADKYGAGSSKGPGDPAGAGLVKQWRRLPGLGAVEQPVMPWQLSGHCSASGNNCWLPRDVL